jgi:cation diffusion facilitator CzcD-associated flavoprotein CzcO
MEESADTHARVLIIGAGFSGLAMAIRLKQRGMNDFIVLERAEEVGGTWLYNSYPGCMCDVPSHLYSLSFAPNPDWSHTYSPQPEIQRYLHDCADRFGILPHLRTGAEVLETTWQEDEERWSVQTSAGTFTGTLLVSGMGPLTEPVIPEIAGLERFAGKIMHSARWDHDYELRGRRVASIGTGASAIQYVPAIQEEVEHLDVYQRTAPWVMPHGDRGITDFERSLYRRMPIAQRAIRGAVYAGKELLVFGFVKDPRLMGLIEKLARMHIRKQVSNPRLREQVTPDYTIGCKRMLPSNRWYPALEAANVELVTAGIGEVREHSIVDLDGVEREVDTIILGTGFHVTDTPYAQQVRGRDGVRISDVWQGSPRAYLGTSVPGFPNLFVLLGPNTGLGHSSMVYMIESQVEHVLGALDAIDRSGARTIEVRPEAHAAFNREVDARMRGTVWDVGGCASFYLDASGRNATLWPDWTWRFRQRAAHFDAGAYTLAKRRPRVPA